MQFGRATGGQLAFLMFAVLLIMVPASRLLIRAYEWTPEQALFVERYLSVLALGALLVAIPSLRRWSLQQLRVKIRPEHHRETWLLAALAPMFLFAVLGGLVLWRWIAEGPSGLAQWVRSWPAHELQMARSLTPLGLAGFLVMAIVGPVVEELVFRAMLFRAWAERWGWFVATLLSSAVFGLYHAEFWHAFVIGMIYTVLYRRTGSLLAPILVHGVYNTLAWYPALGQWAFMPSLPVPGDLWSWAGHLACFVLAAIAVPAYLLLGRQSGESMVWAADIHEPVPR